MTDKSTFFFIFHTTSSASSIVFADGSSKHDTGTDTETVNLTSLALTDVNYILHVPFNLVSVSHLTNAFQYSITFFFIMYCSGSHTKVIGEGCEQHDLYYLQFDDQPKVGVSTLPCDESAIQWHLCLGCVSLKFIKLLLFLLRHF